MKFVRERGCIAQVVGGVRETASIYYILQIPLSHESIDFEEILNAGVIELLNYIIRIKYLLT